MFSARSSSRSRPSTGGGGIRTTSSLLATLTANAAKPSSSTSRVGDARPNSARCTADARPDSLSLLPTRKPLSMVGPRAVVTKPNEPPLRDLPSNRERVQVRPPPVRDVTSGGTGIPLQFRRASTVVAAAVVPTPSVASREVPPPPTVTSPRLSGPPSTAATLRSPPSATTVQSRPTVATLRSSPTLQPSPVAILPSHPTTTTSRVSEPQRSEKRQADPPSILSVVPKVVQSTPKAAHPATLVSKEPEMERRHTGKWVRDYPTSGYFACSGCTTPIANVTSKVPSIKGYATFSSYYEHSVELGVVVPHMGMGSSFVAINCVKCRSFLGRLCCDEVDDDIGCEDLSQFNSNSLRHVSAPVPAGFESTIATDDRVTRRRRVRGSVAVVDDGSSETDSDADVDDDLWCSMRTHTVR